MQCDLINLNFNTFKKHCIGLIVICRKNPALPMFDPLAVIKNSLKTKNELRLLKVNL